MLKLTTFLVFVFLCATIVNANRLPSLFKKERKVRDSYACPEKITFPNNSYIYLADNYKQLAGFFSSFKQTGIAPGTYSWGVSLCDAVYIPPGGSICKESGAEVDVYLSQHDGPTSVSCPITFPTRAIEVQPSNSGDHITFKYTSTSNGLDWLSTVRCYCDPSATSGLVSPSGSYQASQSNSGVIDLEFDFVSAGCCAVSPSPTPSPAPPTASPPSNANACNQVNFPNGSSISFANTYKQLAAYFPTMKQLELAPGEWPWMFSMCDRNYLPPGGQPCKDSTSQYVNAFLSERYDGSNPDRCDVTFTSLPDVQAGAGGNHVTFIYLSTSNNLAWRTSVHCYCDPSVATLSSPSNSYTASQSNAGIIELNFNVSASACCVRTMPPPPPTLSPVPTTSSPSGQSCPSEVTFPNGSIASLNNFPQLSGYFNSLEQVGLAPGTFSWQLSLCSSSYVPSPGNPCHEYSQQIDAFLSERNGNAYVNCDVIFSTSPQVVASEDHIRFTYTSNSNNLQWSADVHCFCDPTATQTLAIPSNTYAASQTQSGIIELKFDVASASCCASSSPVPTPSPSSNNACPSEVRFNDGTIVDLHDAAPHLTTAYTSLHQEGFAQGNYGVSFSLCDKFLTPKYGDDTCGTDAHYIYEGYNQGECNWPFRQFSGVFPYVEDDGAKTLRFVYTNSSQKWQFEVRCSCDPLAVEQLKIPTRSYNAEVKSGTYIFLTINVTSSFCCARSNNSITTTTGSPTNIPPPPPPPHTSMPTTPSPVSPPSPISQLCNIPIQFPNGSKVDLTKSPLFGFFPDAVQQGILPGEKHAWFFNLCSPGTIPPNIAPPNTPSCVQQSGSFLAEGTSCSSVNFADMANFPSMSPDGESILFEYMAVGHSQRYKAQVSCSCDKSADENSAMKLIGNSYLVSYPDAFLYQFSVSSRGCCAV